MAEGCDEKHESALSVVQVLGKGRGVVAVEPLLEGQVVCEYEGELITAREGRKRGEEYGSNVGSYLYFFHYKSKHLCVDATKENETKGRLINHSRKSPNLVTKVREVDGTPRLYLLAKRNIVPGEELLYDYGVQSTKSFKENPWLKT